MLIINIFHLLPLVILNPDSVVFLCSHTQSTVSSLSGLGSLVILLSSVIFVCVFFLFKMNLITNRLQLTFILLLLGDTFYSTVTLTVSQ